VTLRIYDVLGREVRTLVNKELNSGKYEIEFDASSLSSGIYFYSLRAGSFASTKKIVLMK
ncbi:MAG: T9SS type A sorting domain-containing protein, partial [Ignavibacteriales bacterium]|nr:T9SS type A sorting domain-containing protein [Ignavibacteriales bacterium]